MSTNKILELAKIAKEIARCKECIRGKHGLPVPGEGNPDAKIMLVGESPGAEESKTGRPFIGRAGKFLNKLLEMAKIDREKIFITSPIKYYPGRRNIRNDEIEHGKTHLQKQIEVIKPRLIVLLGNVAIKATLGKGYKLSEIHGKLIRRDNFFYFPTFHPAAAMRFPKIKKLAESDFKKLRNISYELINIQ